MKLKEIRRKRGLTLKQVAEKVEAAESTICLYERGKRSPNLEMAMKLASALGVTVDELIGKEEAS